MERGFSKIKIHTNLFLDYKRFYFVHSYHMYCSNPDNVYTNSIHGAEFTSVVGKENILGVQFHLRNLILMGSIYSRNFRT